MGEPNPLNDSLGVLATTRRVVDLAAAVRIDAPAIEALAERIARHDLTPAVWDSTLHWSGAPDATANYILVLDALNFCFWGEPRWRIEYAGAVYDGYWALAASLKRALEKGVPLTDAGYLAEITRDDVATIFAGEGEIPLLDERARIL
ncbi:MAG TPA: queuosine salvage family protein, partial [Nitrolancea sp.]